jgi:hypothetical protein
VRITNVADLPAAIVQAVSNDPYDKSGPKGDITVSTLIGPPQIAVLRKRHWNEIEEDARDRVWALLGQATHAILERAEPSELAELRLESEFAKWRVSGQFDRLHLSRGKLSDYKVTSAWTVVYGDRVPEWERQQNVYAELIERHGGEVREAEIVAILRDWSRSQAEKDSAGKYPRTPIVAIPLRLWPREERVAYIEERVRLHQQGVIGNVAPCTDEERWAKAPVWAVMKEGRKTAVKLCDSKADAESLRASYGGDLRYYVEHRPGEYTRCLAYCPVSKFCPQWAKDRPQEAA